MENTGGKEIRIAAKMYEYRDVCKAFWTEKFQTEILPYKQLIEAVMVAKSMNAMEAFLDISASRHYQESGITQLMYISALVEMLEPEPSDTTNK